MSQEDLEALAHIVSKPIRQRDNVKIWVAVLGFTGTIFVGGMTGGNWQYWRAMVDRRLDKLEAAQETNQAIKNKVRAEKNAHITVKSDE